MATNSECVSALDAGSGHCWLCGLKGKRTTRVVTTQDLPLLHDLQRRGIIDLYDINASENLFVLCTACEEAFNDPAVVWIFLPTSLDAIIADEEEFHVRRKRAAAAGEQLPRPPPGPVAILPVLYSRYQIRRGHLFTHVFTNAPIAMWAGSPLAAIIRSARLSPGVERVPVREGGLPMDVALQLQRLLLLYGTPDPELKVNPPAASVAQPTDTPGQPESQLTLIPRRPAGSSTEPTDPNLASIGRAFTATLNYVAAHSAQRNLSPEAHAWLTTEIRSTLHRLRTELRNLRKNKDKPLLLPPYVFNRDIPLKLFSETIPFVLIRYAPDFEECMMRLFRACELDATCQIMTLGGKFLSSYIKFRTNEAEQEGTVGRLFDEGFEEEFVSAVEALRLEG